MTQTSDECGETESESEIASERARPTGECPPGGPFFGV